MIDRDERLGAALRDLPTPEPPEGFWEALNRRCSEVMSSAAPGGGDLVPLRHRAAGGDPLPARPGLSGPGPARRRRGIVPGSRAAGLVATAAIAAVVVALAGLLPRNPAEASIPKVPLSPNCGFDGNAPQASDGTLAAQRIVVAGVWQEGTSEAESFVKVLEAFKRQTGASIIYAYKQSDRDMFPDLKSRIDAGCPPDVALLPQPGMMRELVRTGDLRPLGSGPRAVVDRNYSETARQVGMLDESLYGVWFKAADKSLIWYRTDTFRQMGLEPPRTWEELKAVAARLRAQGLAPFSVAGGDGWTLTDWFENVYLATAGPGMYDRLASHQLSWQDPTVTRALATLREVLGEREWIAGGVEEALRTSYEGSVENLLGPAPKAAMVFEGDFVSAGARDLRGRTGAEGTLASFPFPAIGGVRPAVAGGDVAVMLTRNRAAERLIEFLATPEAAGVWASEGGFLSPNRNLDPGVYPDEAARRSAEALTHGTTFRFDLSDLQPPGFGTTEGMWGALQEFLAHPDDIDRITGQMQAKADATWKPFLTAPLPPHLTRS